MTSSTILLQISKPMIKITSNNAPFIARFGSAKHVEAIDKKYGRGVADFEISRNPLAPSHIIDSIADHHNEELTRYDGAFGAAVEHDSLSKEKYDQLFKEHRLTNVHMMYSKHFTPDHIDGNLTHSIIRHAIRVPNISGDHLDKLLSDKNVGLIGSSYDSAVRTLAKNPNLKSHHITNLLQHGKIDNLDVSELIPHKEFKKEHLEMIQDRIPKSESIRSELSRKVFE